MLGLLATVAAFAVIVIALVRARTRDAVAIGMLAATVALAVHQIGDDLFFFTKVGEAFWLALGLGAAAGYASRLNVAAVRVSATT